MDTRDVPDRQCKPLFACDGEERDYEKPTLELFPDYLDTTLQQTIIISNDLKDML